MSGCSEGWSCAWLSVGGGGGGGRGTGSECCWVGETGGGSKGGAWGFRDPDISATGACGGPLWLDVVMMLSVKKG